MIIFLLHLTQEREQQQQQTKKPYNMKRVLVVVFVGIFQMGFCSLERDYISWEDLRVDDINNNNYYNYQQIRFGLASRDHRNSNVIVVDKNGRGDSLTVQGAIDMVPKFNNRRIKIFILPGIYREKIFIPSSKPYISLIGNQSKISETVISWNNKASDKGGNGIELGTYHSASVTIESDYFCATAVTFENTVVADPRGHGMQAVAVRIGGDKAVFYKVRILGTQDTLLDDVGSHYFFKSYIQGSVDFIFGRARSLYKDCFFQSTARYGGAIAAHHRDHPEEKSGFSFENCVVKGTGEIYLGRAWGDYSRIIYSYCQFDDIIIPSGWSDWNRTYRQKTVEFGEFSCQGAGADRKGRVPWIKSFNYDEIKPYLSTEFIDGQKWLRL